MGMKRRQLWHFKWYVTWRAIKAAARIIHMFLYSEENQLFISTFQVNYEKYVWFYEFKSC